MHQNVSVKHSKAIQVGEKGFCLCAEFLAE